MRRLAIIISSSILAFAALAVATQAGDTPSAAAQAPAGQPAQSITVRGGASVTVVPDQAQLWFGVESQATTARAALAANSNEMRKVLAALKSAGASNVQTQNVSLSPRYVEGRGVEGYSAHNSVTVTVKQLAQAGAVIDAAVAAGANQVAGPALSLAETSSHYRRALAAAVADARANATALAAASGLSLGRVTAVVEGDSGPSPAALTARAADESASPPFEAGEQQVTAIVTVTFAAS